ncbi:MAG: type II toxin-antitoxin system VapC family toxin [Deltaproteobacteria bacterium]|nr:type II toxin-antitoxin system VapC family toxin [Deltaproteobacteria bacterium]
MIYMLYTNICIHTIRKKPRSVFGALRKLSPDSVATSAITEAELRFGMSNSSRPEHNHRVLDEFLGPFQVLSFASVAAIHYGDIRLQLKRTGTPIKSMDLLIVAQARSPSATLATNNVRALERVPGLKWEN